MGQTLSRRSARLSVDLDALVGNLAAVRRLAGHREVIASIKADAYGFGVVEVSRALVGAGVKRLWTGNLDEAIMVRQAGVEADILLFGGIEPVHYPAVLAHDLEPTLTGRDELGALAAAARQKGRCGRAWVKIDAGLGRLGVTPDEAATLIAAVVDEPSLRLQGVYSHLPFGDADGRGWAAERALVFEALIRRLRENGVVIPVVQLWGSSGLLAGMADASEAVCIGHALYGLNPLHGVPDAAIPLRPVFGSLSAGIARVSHADGGTARAGGYGDAVAGSAATVAIGLGDGLRRAGAGAHVLINGARAPIRGFTLEHLIVDAREVPSPAPWQRATLIGRNGDAAISLDDWAAWTGATPLDLMMGFAKAVPIRYVGGEA